MFILSEITAQDEQKGTSSFKTTQAYTNNRCIGSLN